MSYNVKRAAIDRALWLEGDFVNENPTSDDGPSGSQLLTDLADAVDAKGGNPGLVAEARERILWLLAGTPQSFYEQANRARRATIDCFAAPALLRRLAEVL